MTGNAKKAGWVVSAILVGLLVVLVWKKPITARGTNAEPTENVEAPDESKKKLAAVLAVPLVSNRFPEELEVALEDVPEKYQANYTLDWISQTYMDNMFKLYKPDYGAFVALDATTGKILTLLSYTREKKDLGNLALRATYPAASVFKIVTATAAVDQRRLHPESVMGFNGANHTLYKKNVTQTENNKWTRFVTLSQAFAKSVNTVFAKIGLYFLQPDHLRQYASRFRFNEAIPADVPIQVSRFALPDNDIWAIAEAASGFNRVATLSPMQGALIAAAVANEGMMMEPYVVDSLVSKSSEVAYRGEARPMVAPMSPETAFGIRHMMQQTVKQGTSAKAFRKFFDKKSLSDLEVGGKTGSLVGMDPKGKYDWFVGYGIKDGRKIAVASLTINVENWRVKSSFLARSYLEQLFSR